jgi:hypothetical protein
MSDWKDWIDELRRKLQRVQKKVSAAEFELDSVTADLDMAEHVAGGADSAPLPRRCRRSKKETDEWQRHARIGVDSLVIARRSDDSADVLVNGIVHLVLSPKLADLLVLLAARTGPPEDGLVGWKTRASLIAGLGTPPHQPTEKHNLGQLILRLRNKLEAAGLNRFFVAVNRRKGARFNLKASAAVLSVSDGDR